MTDSHQTEPIETSIQCIEITDYQVLYIHLNSKRQLVVHLLTKKNSRLMELCNTHPVDGIVGINAEKSEFRIGLTVEAPRRVAMQLSISKNHTNNHPAIRRCITRFLSIPSHMRKTLLRFHEEPPSNLKQQQKRSKAILRASATQPRPI